MIGIYLAQYNTFSVIYAIRCLVSVLWVSCDVIFALTVALLFSGVESGGRVVERRTVNRWTVVQSHLPPFRN